MYRPDRARSFGAAIKQLLDEKKLSQRQFAKQAGLTTDYVSKLVNGEIAEPRQGTRCKIAMGLEISEQELQAKIEQYINSEPEPPTPVSPGLAVREAAIAATASRYPIANRTQELQLFSQMISQPTSTRILLVKAPSGFGKSDLLKQFRQRCPQEVRVVPLNLKAAEIGIPYVFDSVCRELGYDSLLSSKRSLRTLPASLELVPGSRRSLGRSQHASGSGGCVAVP